MLSSVAPHIWVRLKDTFILQGHEEHTLHGSTVRRWWAPPHMRSVPLKGIHRLFSEAEQVRLIVARVGGPISALLPLSHSREPVSRRRMIDGTTHPPTGPCCCCCCCCWWGREMVISTLGTRREGRRVIDAQRIHRPALGKSHTLTHTARLYSLHTQR